MGDVIKVAFTPEEQDLLGKIDSLYEAAEDRDIVSISYVVQTDDGSYEMCWGGDVEHTTAIEALKVLIRHLRREGALLAKKAANA